MQLNFRFINTLILFAVLVITANTSFAQYPGMRQVYSNMAMQQATRQMQMQMMMRNGMYRFSANNEEEHDFRVKMKDSSVKLVRSAVFLDKQTKKRFLIYVDKNFQKKDTAHYYQKIFPDQTISIDQSTYSFKAKKVTDVPEDNWLPGVVNDTCWMFKIIDGPINLYAYAKDMHPTGFVIQDENNKPLLAIAGIQTGTGPIESFTTTNLKKRIWRNTDAMESFFEYDYETAIKRYNKETLKEAKKKAKEEADKK